METETSLAFDPVCGMRLEPEKIAVTYTYLGQTYRFCCTECRELFARAPDTCIVLLAHEPEQSMGYHCLRQHQALLGQEQDTKEAQPSLPGWAG